MWKFVIAIVVGIATTAIARGIVLAFGLDKVISDVLSKSTTFAGDHTETIVWLGCGLIGLVTIILWHAAHLDERVRNICAPAPKAGSLPFVSFELPIARNISTNECQVELVCVLRNANDALVMFDAKLWGG